MLTITSRHCSRHASYTQTHTPHVILSLLCVAVNPLYREENWSTGRLQGPKNPPHPLALYCWVMSAWVEDGGCSLNRMVREGLTDMETFKEEASLGMDKHSAQRSRGGNTCACACCVWEETKWWCWSAKVGGQTVLYMLSRQSCHCLHVSCVS